MFQLSQVHGAGDGGGAAVHEHLLAALLAGGGAVAEELGVDLALGQPGTLDELVLELAYRIVVLEQGEQCGDRPAEDGGATTAVLVEAAELPPSMTAEAWVIWAAVSESRRKSLREERWGWHRLRGRHRPATGVRASSARFGGSGAWVGFKGPLALTSTARPRVGRAEAT